MNETIACKTIEVGRDRDGSLIFASARTARAGAWGSLVFHGAAWIGNGDGGDWIPPRECVAIRNGPREVRDQAWARISADMWFGFVRDELWKRSHPSSVPQLPESP